jgi:DNA helicase-2/ATP-dependent DNA helicase PcrA
MYVAVTRARERLYLTHAQTRMLHGQTRYCLPSAFVDELPADLLRKINRALGAGGQGPAPARAAVGSGWPAATHGLRIGQNVRHARFGVGVIVSTEGAGPEARVQVNFGSGGMKWLALEYAG